MLGKLMRYDFKVQLKLLFWAYLMTAVFAIISGIFTGLKDAYPSNLLLSGFGALACGICIFSIIVMMIGTGIYVVLFFRKNLLKDEGYLMHTLPVTASDLYLSKFFTAFICILISGVVAYFCYAIGSLNLTWGKDVIELFQDNPMGCLLWMSFLIGIPAGLSQFYLCLSIGYTWKMNRKSSINRDLMSFLVYIIIYMIQQIVSVISLVGYVAIRYFDSIFELNKLLLQDQEVLDFVNGMMIMSDVLAIIALIVCSWLSIYRLKRNLNLE